MKKCVCREGQQGTDRQEEIMVVTVLLYRKTVTNSAWSDKKEKRWFVGKKTRASEELVDEEAHGVRDMKKTLRWNPGDFARYKPRSGKRSAQTDC